MTALPSLLFARASSLLSLCGRAAATLVCACTAPARRLSSLARRYKLRHLSTGSALARSVAPELWPKPRRMSSQVVVASGYLLQRARDACASSAGIHRQAPCDGCFRRHSSCRAASRGAATCSLVSPARTMWSQRLELCSPMAARSGGAAAHARKLRAAVCGRS